MFRKSVAQRLFNRKNAQILLVNEPPRYREKIGALPEDATVIYELAGPVDFIQFFITTQSELEAQLSLLKSALKPDGILWVTFPRRNSPEMGRKQISAYAEALGLRQMGQITVNEDWTALRLEISETPFALEL